MNNTTEAQAGEVVRGLQQVRAEIYDTCLKRSRDALFNLIDAMLSEPMARSLPEFSLSAFFEREWPSVYKALQNGKIDTAPLRALWVKILLSQSSPNKPVLIALDTSNIERLEAETSEDRGMIHLSNLPLADKPIGIGWTYSTVVLLPDQPCSWAPILDQQRVVTDSRPVLTAIAQLAALKPLFGDRPVVVIVDRGYGTPEFLRACQDLGYSCLVRIKSDRRLYRPGVRVHKRGPIPKNGPVFQGKRQETHSTPAQTHIEKDAKGRVTTSRLWDDLHFKEDPDLKIKVVSIEKKWASGTKRDPRVSWFVVLGDEIPVSKVAICYALRFSIEHCYRFLKQHLLWSRVHVHTPEQFDRWTWLVSIVFNQLCLARDLGQAAHNPWEKKNSPITPEQVRRVMPSILQQLGTPARPCQPRGIAPGRPKGFHPEPRERFPVVVKNKKNKKNEKKAEPSQSAAA